jgi:hypothetical protein
MSQKREIKTDSIILQDGEVTGPDSISGSPVFLSVNNSQTGTSVTIGNTTITAPFGTIAQNLNISFSSNVATIEVSGHYMMSFDATFGSSTNTESRYTVVAQRDPGGGGSYSNIVGTTYVVHQNANNSSYPINNVSYASYTAYLGLLEAGDLIRLRITGTNANSRIYQTEGRFPRLVIYKLG